ncbi:MAG: bifunctional UDP-sugar hydrolase/5'-nucleotidase [Bacteriovoracia bacterium]
MRYFQLTGRFFFYSFILAFLSGVSSCPEVTSPTNAPVEITLLHTNDVHSHYVAEANGSEKNPFGVGGLAKLKTLVDQIRSQKQNTLLLDAGDWSEGSIYYLTDGGSQILRIFDAIGYDATVVGNHDFYNGPSELLNTINRAQPKVTILGANKDMGPFGNRSEFESKVVPYKIFTVGTQRSVRIAVIGLLTDDITYASYFKPGLITPALEAASKITRKIHDNDLADVIVLLSHNSFESNVRLAQQVPWVNAVISGHSHVKTSKPVLVDNAGTLVPVVEAYKWGQFLGDLTFEIDLENKLVKFKAFDLRPVVSSLPEDPKVASLVQASNNAIIQKFGRNVFESIHLNCDHDMPQHDDKEMVLANMAADSYRELTGADIALESNATLAVGPAAGDLNLYEVFHISPYIYHALVGGGFPDRGQTWTVQVIPFNGGALEMTMNFILLAQKLKLGIGWIATSGLEVIYGTRDKGLLPVDSVKVLNSKTNQFELVDENKTYKLALHDGLLLSLQLLEEKFNIDVGISQRQDSGVTTWQAILQHIQRKGGLRAGDYERGVRYKTLEADASISEHDINLVSAASSTGRGIEVTVHNGSLEMLKGVTVQVFRGKVNDVVNDTTDGNEVIAINSPLQIPEIPVGESRKIVIPWNNAEGAGIYAIKAVLSMSAVDAVVWNNSAIRHFRL